MDLCSYRHVRQSRIANFDQRWSFLNPRWLLHHHHGLCHHAFEDRKGLRDSLFCLEGMAKPDRLVQRWLRFLRGYAQRCVCCRHAVSMIPFFSVFIAPVLTTTATVSRILRKKSPSLVSTSPKRFSRSTLSAS